MKALIAVACIVLTGCATTYKFKAKMDGFVGQPESVIVGAYGPPQSFYALADGSRVLQYTRGGVVSLPGTVTTVPITTNTTGSVTMNQGMRQSTGIFNERSTTYVQQQGAPIVINASCTVRFTVDREGIVRRWASEGNHCVSD